MWVAQEIEKNDPITLEEGMEVRFGSAGERYTFKTGDGEAASKKRKKDAPAYNPYAEEVPDERYPRGKKGQHRKNKGRGAPTAAVAPSSSSSSSSPQAQALAPRPAQSTCSQPAAVPCPG